MRAILAALALLLPAAAAPDRFASSYPAQVRAIPALKARLDAETMRLRTAFYREAAADVRMAKGHYPHHPWEKTRTWKVVADTPRFLSLSMEQYAYTGGAHGGTVFDALVWDKRARAAHKPIALFTSTAAVRGAIRAPFCDALDRARAARRGGPVKRSAEPFYDCIDPTQQTLILGSSNRRTFDRIGVLIGPYAAGSYAEGTYDITLPVTPALLAAVRPAYRATFSVKR